MLEYWSFLLGGLRGELMTLKEFQLRTIWVYDHPQLQAQSKSWATLFAGIGIEVNGNRILARRYVSINLTSHQHHCPNSF